MDAAEYSYKTERGGTFIHLLGGERTEILSGFSYTTTAGKFAPIFVNDDPFAVRVQETRGGSTKTLGKDEAHTVRYSGYSAGRYLQPTAKQNVIVNSQTVTSSDRPSWLSIHEQRPRRP